MSQKNARKFRKEVRRLFKLYLKNVGKLKFADRLSLAWKIMWTKKEKP